MTVTSISCSISKQHAGRSIYFKPKIAEAMAEHFPLSNDKLCSFEYKAEFDDVTKILTIRKDERS